MYGEGNFPFFFLPSIFIFMGNNKSTYIPSQIKDNKNYRLGTNSIKLFLVKRYVKIKGLTERRRYS